jgi:hypothetical protein
LATPFRLTRPEPPEAAIQDAVLRFLQLDPRVAWAHRFNTGAMKIPTLDANGRQRGQRFVRFAFKGCADVLGQLSSGHFLAVEVKRPSTRPTAEQAAFLAQVEANRGLAVVARGIDDLERALDRFCAGLPAANPARAARAAQPERAGAGGAAPPATRPAPRLEAAP